MSTDAMPLPDPALLPDDPAVLKQLVVQLLEELRKEHGARERLEHHIHLLLKRIYGSSSEKFDPQQGVLFDPQSGDEETALSTPAPPPTASPVSKNRHQHGRGRIPAKIERQEVVYDLTDAEKAALGGVENLVELPPERSEQLDWRPSALFVIVHVRKKYARKVQLPESGLTLSEQNVVVACKPAEAIPGGLAAPGLMAQVIVNKGADHLPLHRLEGIFKRQGVHLSRQTMDGWWLQTAEFCRPLYALAVRVVLASHVIHTDDSATSEGWRVQWETKPTGAIAKSPVAWMAGRRETE
jgi:transposase